MHGEAGQCNLEGVAHARAELPEVLKHYKLRNTFNLDESALFLSKKIDENHVIDHERRY